MIDLILTRVKDMYYYKLGRRKTAPEEFYGKTKFIILFGLLQAKYILNADKS